MKTNSGKMKNKTYKQCEEFFKKNWDDKKIRIHSECVIETCINASYKTKLNENIFIIAGWIHDLGIKIDKENHHIISLNFLKKFLEEHQEYKKFENEIKDCILNHRSEGKPETIYGLLFKCADKIALHHNKWTKFKKNQ
jgi:metal-dependent HD superfamily phosphatase/phosphodiesterase